MASPLPPAKFHPGNFPVQARGGKFIDVEIDASKFRHQGIASDTVNTGSATFTNTSYADLDALTGTPLGSPCKVTLMTGPRALVFWKVQIGKNDGNSLRVSYRVSGATTIASRNDVNVMLTGQTASPLAYIGAAAFHLEALTPGENTFELQAKVGGGTGYLFYPELLVIPI